MNVEIRKVNNGYIVLPMPLGREYGVSTDHNKVYVFRDYRDLTNKLQDILEAPEPKNDHRS